MWFLECRFPLGWGIGVVSIIDQFLRPWLIGPTVQIPALFLVFSVLGGLALYGLIGLFVGPVLGSLLMTTSQIYREEYHHPETALPVAPPHRLRSLSDIDPSARANDP
ncbi:MAG: AI-2E family transporter [Nitrospirota bacterium]